MKVLHIAESANPEWVSVPLVGWSNWKALSEVTESLLVTQVRNKESIERTGLVDGKDFISINSEFVAKPFDKLGNLLSGGKGVGWTTKMAFMYFPYLYFEFKVWKKLGKRIRAGEFDIVHRITPLTPTMPSPLARKCKKYRIPFVLGPLNGGLPWPKEFNSERRREKEWLSYIRSSYKILPGYFSTRENSTAIIVGSKATLEQLEKRYHKKSIYIPENGIDLNRFSKKRSKSVGPKLKAVFIGRLVPYKGAHMLLKGIQEYLRNDKIALAIVGDGPERKNLEKLSKKLYVEKNVFFHGWVEHDKVQNYIIDSDILIFPSIREFGGGVVLEAMGLGVMPLVANYGGPSELVDNETGVFVDLGSEELMINGIKMEIAKLIENPDLIDIKGAKSKELVLDLFTWARKAEQIKQVYEWVLGKNKTKPVFDFPWIRNKN